MFNAPRPVQPYGGGTSQFGASFMATENPLLSSVYDDGLDPWSAAPSPAPPALPSFTPSTNGFSSVIGMYCGLACAHMFIASRRCDCATYLQPGLVCC